MQARNNRIRAAFMFLVLVSALLLLSCSGYTAKIEKLSGDNEIAINERSSVLILAIQNRDIPQILDMSADTIHNEGGLLEDGIEQISNLMENEPEIIDEYYIRFSDTGDSPVLLTPDLQNQEYSLSVQPLQEEMAVALVEYEKGEITYLLSQVYVKESDGWLLAGLINSDYKYEGMNAPQMFEKVKELKDDSENVTAALYGTLLLKIVQPGLLSYSEAQDIINFVDASVLELQKTVAFPFAIETQGGAFDIIGVDSTITQEGIACYVNYLSDAGLDESNSVQLKAEADAITKEIDRYMGNITKNFEVILIRAFNEFPKDRDKTYASYTTVITKEMVAQ